MSNKSLTIVLGVFGGLLFILIISTSLAGLSLNRKNTNISPTPFTSSSDDSEPQSEREDGQSLSSVQPLGYIATDEELRSLIESSEILEDDDADNLKELIENLPTQTEGFNLRFLTSDGKVSGFTASISGSSGHQNLGRFLARFGLDKLLNDQNIFSLSNDPEDATDTDEGFLTNTNPQDKKAQKIALQKAKEAEVKATKPLVDALKSMIDFPKHEENASSGSTNCQSTQGNEKILCEALKYDPLGYSQSQRALPSVWKRSKCPNIDPANPGCVLDCSGLVGQAIFDAFGADRYLTTAIMPSQTDILREIPLTSVKTGDIVWKPGHTAIVEKYDGQLTVFHATSPQTGIAHYTYSSGLGSYTKGYRYIGPGGTP